MPALVDPLYYDEQGNPVYSAPVPTPPVQGAVYQGGGGTPSQAAPPVYGPPQQPTTPYQPPPSTEGYYAEPARLAGQTTTTPPADAPVGGVLPRPEGKTQYMPGPPRNYIPGSTYIPPVPNPDPRIPYSERVGKVVASNNAVPGTQGYRRDPAVMETQPYISPGLGAGSALSPGPLSRHGRELAPRDPERYTPYNPQEPQDYQPGSTYIPSYIAMPPIGDPRRQWVPERSSIYYGGTSSAGGSTRPKDSRRIDALTPATGGAETARYIPTEDGTVLLEGNAPPRVYVRSEPGPPQAAGSNIGQPLEETFRQMEEARRVRMRPLIMRGLFGGTMVPERVTRGGG